MSVFNRALAQVERGRRGDNVGIPIPFSRLRQFLPNIQQSTYYLIGAGTKVGKTSFADDLFFYGAYDYYKELQSRDALDGFELDIDYFSYEIDSQTKIIKGIGRKLWHEYGIIADANTILSRGESRCSDELYQLVLKYREYFDEMEDVVTIHDMPDNPTGIYKYINGKAAQHGTIHRKNINSDPEGNPVMRFDRYEINNPKRYWIGMVDHIALAMEERNFNTKQTIDKLSQYMVGFRNNYGMSPVIIQQLAFDSESDERHKSGRLTPTLKDFGDSKYTTRDANVIMTLFSPYRYQLDQFQGYNVAELGNSYRSLEILENRDGEPNINLGLNFIGPCGTFRELPRSSEMSPERNAYAASLANVKSKYYKNESGIWLPRN
tara:strand:+ start:7627 stop:8760 length:1134 start_codon:yes stop_codon:yes gene_type:complete